MSIHPIRDTRHHRNGIARTFRKIKVVQASRCARIATIARPAGTPSARNLLRHLHMYTRSTSGRWEIAEMHNQRCETIRVANSFRDIRKLWINSMNGRASERERERTREKKGEIFYEKSLIQTTVAAPNRSRRSISRKNRRNRMSIVFGIE